MAVVKRGAITGRWKGRRESRARRIHKEGIRTAERRSDRTPAQARLHHATVGRFVQGLHHGEKVLWSCVFLLSFLRGPSHPTRSLARGMLAGALARCQEYLTGYRGAVTTRQDRTVSAGANLRMTASSSAAAATSSMAREMARSRSTSRA